MTGRPIARRFRRGRHRRLGGDRSDFSLQRYLATRDQYRHDDRDVPDGLPDPEHAEPRLRGDAGQARRAHPRDGRRHNALLDLEELEDEELDRLKAAYVKLANQAREVMRLGQTDTDVPDAGNLSEFRIQN